MQAVYLPDEQIPNEFTELAAQRPIPSSSTGTTDTTFRPLATIGRSSSTPSSRATCWNFFTSPTEQRRLQNQSRRPLLFGLVGVSIVATAVILLLPPLVLGSTPAAGAGVLSVPSLFRLHRHRLHPDPGRADSEVRPVARTSDVRADGDHLFHADLAAGSGSFFSRQFLHGATTRG